MADRNGTKGNAGGSTALQTRPTQAVRRWDPFDMFDEMEQRMAQLWNQIQPWSSQSLFRPSRGSTERTQMTNWTPTMDVFEQGGKLVIKADLPGVKKEDIDIEIDQGSLVIKGQRHSENEVRDEHYYRLERSAGSFYRRLPLPEGVKPDQVEAKFNDGVLEVRLPKPAQEQPQRQRIPITTS